MSEEIERFAQDAQDDASDSGKGAGAKLTKKALLEAVATATGQKKPAAKAVIDAVLAEISAALARGDTLVLPPLGKLSVGRTKAGKGGEISVLKLRQTKDAGPKAASEDGDDD